MVTELQRLSKQLARMLAEKKRLLVFAESCTAGLVSASLSQVPGISRYLCGAMVVYQNASKNAWLGIDEAALNRPGSVSQLVASQMATRVLEKTPQAHLAASVTGHLGPLAPPKLDGIVFIAVSERTQDAKQNSTVVSRHRLRTSSRRARQREAAALVLKSLIRRLESV